MLHPKVHVMLKSEDTYFVFIKTINQYLLCTSLEELTLPPIEEKTKKSSAFTCPNIICGQVFNNPIKALDLQRNSEQPYAACPYCLTEIEADTVSGLAFEAEPAQNEEKMQVEKEIDTSEKLVECTFYLGYLSERPSKEQIPNDCLTCKDIVTCMLKKMKE